MTDLIEALTIFSKYVDEPNSQSPTHCEHDELRIMGVGKAEVSDEDVKRLDELGFFWQGPDDCWMSFKFGSA